MAFSGGVFSRLYNWATEQASPPIEIAKLDTQEEDFATALSNCVLRDGTGVPTADTPWNSKKITGIANSTTRTGVPATSQVQDESFVYLGSVSGTDTITASLTPAITAYATGQRVVFKPAATNTGAVTMNVNSLGAKTVKKWSGTALAAGDLVINIPAMLIYDGTDFYLQEPRAVDLTNFDGTYAVGYRNVPISSQSANYTLVLGDAGKTILHPSGGGASDTFTIPANASVAYPLGTVLTFVNADSNSVSIAITTDTMTLAGATSTGTRTLGQNGIATAIKMTSTTWLICGTALT